ncbi:MAG: hypothetical protein KJ709_00840, partial [Nanoarchaeota archaeon]|nr:hypothetical protein [Nanoarchaeota archaeon]
TLFSQSLNACQVLLVWVVFVSFFLVKETMRQILLLFFYLKGNFRKSSLSETFKYILPRDALHGKEGHQPLQDS